MFTGVCGNGIDLKLKLIFHEEEKQPYLIDVSSLLYDIELIHDLCLIIGAEDYSDYGFSRFFWYRNGRPIKQNHKLRAARIIKDSPLTIELLLTGIVAFPTSLWLLIQAIDRISNFRLNRRKLELEIEKLQLEVNTKRTELEQRLQEKKSLEIFEALFERFNNNPIKLEDLELKAKDNSDQKERVRFT